MHVLARASLFLLLASPFTAVVVSSGCSETTGGGSTPTTGGTGTSSGTGGSGGASASSGAGASSGTFTSSSTGASSGAGGTGTSAGGAGGTSSTGTGGAGGAPVFYPAPCQGKVYECGDTIDNDGDGKIDWMDPDCLGPCDNTEDSYEIGIPGAEGAGCVQDCYWDNDSGSGNDQCYWNHKCDEHEMDPNWYPESWLGDMCKYDPNANTPGTPESCDTLYMTQLQGCYDVCGPLTPNGCDCFGCCELPTNPGNYVWLGSHGPSGTTVCTLAELTNPDVCSPCKPVQACLNPCDPCVEVCFPNTMPINCNPPDGGVPEGGVPEGGTDSGTPMQCPPGITPCGVNLPPCPQGWYCITGCCQAIPT